MTTPTVVPSTNPATALLLARVSRSTTWLLLAVAIGLSAVLQPDFFSAYSIASSFSGFLPLVLLAVGQAVVIIGGGLDLSLGASLGLASVVGLLVLAQAHALPVEGVPEPVDWIGDDGVHRRADVPRHLFTREIT